MDAAVAEKAKSVAEARGKLEWVLDGADAKMEALKAKLMAKKSKFKGKDPLVAGTEQEETPVTQSGEPPMEATCAVGEVSGGRETESGGARALPCPLL